jgi:lipopolysaccharide assembly protein A
MTGPTPRDDRPYPDASSPADTARQFQPHHVVRRTRTGALWIAAGSFAVILVLLLIFILENGRTVEVSYLGAYGHLPLGVALLLAAVLGMLLVVIPGTVRIIQLRITARKHRMIDARPGRGTPEASASTPTAPGPN